jgi:putative ABC transport system permease protein
MSLGVAAVIILTALGDGARNFVINQFSSIGTNLLVVLPGRAETAGSFPGAVLGQTPRDLTLHDAQLLGRLPQVKRYAPLSIGAAELSTANRLREVTVLGSNENLIPIRHMKLALGSFITQALKEARKLCWVPKSRRLLSTQSSNRTTRRLGDSRFLVSGAFITRRIDGLNTDEIVIIPVDYAQALFNTTAFRILQRLTITGK